MGVLARPLAATIPSQPSDGERPEVAVGRAHSGSGPSAMVLSVTAVALAEDGALGDGPGLAVSAILALAGPYATRLSVGRRRADRRSRTGAPFAVVDVPNGPGPGKEQHGFPLRLVVPGRYGMTSVKWLKAITAITEPSRGVRQAVQYRYKRTEDDPGLPVTRKNPHAAMVPPGVLDLIQRNRYVRAGRVTIEGRAWSGWGKVRASSSARTAGEAGTTRDSASPSENSPGSRGSTSGMRGRPATTSCAFARRTQRVTCNPSTAMRLGTTAVAG